MIYRYTHPEFFTNWPQPNLPALSGRIILYGAGRRGSVAAHCLKKRGIKFICFCDSDPKKQGMEYCGHIVISPEELETQYLDAAILITTNHYHYINNELHEKGFTEVFSCVSLFAEIEFEGYTMYSIEYMSRNIDQYFYTLIYDEHDISYITQLQIPVTMRCTLRCKECNSYIPYVQKGEDFDQDDIILSVNKLLTAYETIGNILLYGGEPLLYKNLYQLVEKFADDPRIEKISIVTNGTLLPDERLLAALKNTKVLVRISDYGKLSRKKNELKGLLNTKGIHTEITDFKYWNANPTVDILNETPEQLRSKVQNCCTIANALTLIKGKIFFCGFSAFYDYFKAVPDYGDNYVNLLSAKESGKELKNKIDHLRQIGKDGLPKYACRFCKFNNFEDNLPVAEQTMETLKFKKVY